MNSSGFEEFQVLPNVYEIKSSRHISVDSHSNTPSKNSKNHTGDIAESVQGETSVEPNTTPTDKTQQKPLQFPEFSYSEIFTRQIPNPSAELKQHLH